VNAAPACAIAIFLFGCTSSTPAPADCPFIIVNVEAGSADAGAVGVYLMGQECARYCDTAYPVCVFVSTTRVKCMAGCA
jgi:hypothetical protein